MLPSPTHAPRERTAAREGKGHPEPSLCPPGSKPPLCPVFTRAAASHRPSGMETSWFQGGWALGPASPVHRAAGGSGAGEEPPRGQRGFRSRTGAFPSGRPGLGTLRHRASSLREGPSRGLLLPALGPLSQREALAQPGCVTELTQ